MSLEFNKVAAAVLTAGVVAMSAGFVSQLLVSPKDLYEDAYPVEVTDGDPSEAPEAEEETLESVLALLGDADAENGESLTRACSACHTFEEGGANRVGPNLWNIVGASHAHAEGFNYSDALAGMSDKPWTYEELNAFLADPDGYAPGTRMSYNGMSDVEDRADLIAYLRSLSDDPADLPSEEEIAAAQKEEGGEDEGSEEGEASEDGEAASEGDSQEGEAAGEDGEAVESGEGEEAAAADMDSELREMIAAADPAEGEGKTRQCAACHTFEEGGANRVGPNLWDVVGQPVAHRDDYNYSSAATDARDEGLEWSFENMAAYLEDPRGWMPGTKMTFAGVRNQEDLAAIIAYLRSLSDDPVELSGEESEGDGEANEEEASEDSEGTEAEGDDAASGGSNETDEEARSEGEAAESEETAAAADADSELREMIAAADPAEGEGKTRQCAACHTFEEGGANRVGPNLWGVIGEPVAHLDNYNYSSAATDARDEGLEWSYENLAAYLEDPRSWMPGTKMTFAGVRSQEDLAAIIAYMRQQGENPPPLD